MAEYKANPTWLHGTLDDNSAEKMIRDSGFGLGAFLVRANGDATYLSYRAREGIKHLRVLQNSVESPTETTFHLERQCEEFPSLVELVRFYSSPEATDTPIALSQPVPTMDATMHDIRSVEIEDDDAVSMCFAGLMRKGLYPASGWGRRAMDLQA
jgi:hypothetical protein